MTPVTKALIKVASKTTKVIPPAAMLDALYQVINSVVEYQKTAAVEASRQEDIRAKRDIAVVMIEAQRTIVFDLCEKMFSERSEAFKCMFRGLDEALTSGKTEEVGLYLGSIVTLAKHSPLQEIRQMANDMSQGKFVLDLTDE